MEILTYVLEGTVEHQDSMGNKEQVPAGEFQIMSAGTGIRHSEYNPIPFMQKLKAALISIILWFSSNAQLRKA